MSSELWPIVILSLRVSGLAITIASLIGIPLGAFLGLARFRGRAIWITCARAGMAMPPVVVGLVLFILLRRNGPLEMLNWLFTESAMVTAQTILAIPFVVSIVVSSIEAIPTGLREQLEALGASKKMIYWTILQESKYGVLFAVAAALGRSLSEVGAVMIVGGNIRGETRVLTTAIVSETRMLHFQEALILGGILVTFALIVNSALLVLNRSTREA